jgi:hypothetical protein
MMHVSKTKIGIIDNRTDEDIEKESSDLVSEIEERLGSINSEFAFEDDLIDFIKKNRVHRLDAADHIKVITKYLSSDVLGYSKLQLRDYMIVYSTDYPNTLFEITYMDSDGNDRPFWCTYFKGGKFQECNVSWVFEKYDENKLQ